jgi:hypothetical protein
MTSQFRPPPSTQSPQVDVCVGLICWGEIKSGLVLRGEGVRLPLHNATYMAPILGKVKSGIAFQLTFLNIKLLKNYTYYCIEKIMEDSEDPSAKIGIFKKIMIIMTFRVIGCQSKRGCFLSLARQSRVKKLVQIFKR